MLLHVVITVGLVHDITYEGSEPLYLKLEFEVWDLLIVSSISVVLSTPVMLDELWWMVSNVFCHSPLHKKFQEMHMHLL